MFNQSSPKKVVEQRPAVDSVDQKTSSPRNQAFVGAQRETKGNLPEKPKKRRNWGKICCFSCVGAFILMLLLLTSAMAASGLVYIPGFSQLLYKEPKPTRMVKVLDSEKLQDQIQKRIEDAVEANKNKEIEVEFSESEITTLINTQKVGEGNLKNLQTVLEPKGLELYGKITSPIHTVFILKVVPEVKDGGILLDPQSLRVGALKIPIKWAMRVSNLDELIKKPIQISPDLKIRDLKLDKGKVKVHLEVLNVKEETEYIPASESELSPETT